MQSSTQVIHFHSGDRRFCGSGDQVRRFTLDECEVTCEVCKSRDTLTLSAQGMAWVEEDRKRRVAASSY